MKVLPFQRKITVRTVMPMVVIFLVMQRRFIEGLTAGAVKDGG